jgi:lipopolysaccharide export system permease protein
LHGILVHDNRVPENAITMMAEEGKLVETAQGPRFLLKNGNRQEINQGKLSFLNFDNYTLDISLYDKSVQTRYADPQELTITDLFTYDKTVSEGENKKRRAEGHQRFIWPLYPLVMALAAVSVLLSGQFNRRGHWQRIGVAIVIGVVLIFSAIGLRNAMALNPSLVILAYINAFVPIAGAIFFLNYERSSPALKAEANT